MQQGTEINTGGGTVLDGGTTQIDKGDFVGRDSNDYRNQAVVTISGESFLASQLRMEGELRAIREKLEQFPQMQRDIADLRSTSTQNAYMFQQNDRRHNRHDIIDLLLFIASLLAYAQLLNR